METIVVRPYAVYIREAVVEEVSAYTRWRPVNVKRVVAQVVRLHDSAFVTFAISGEAIKLTGINDPRIAHVTDFKEWVKIPPKKRINKRATERAQYGGPVFTPQYKKWSDKFDRMKDDMISRARRLQYQEMKK